MQNKAEGNQVLSNLWSARIIPWVLTGVVGYATYVFVALLSVNYLLKRHNDHSAAIPILVIYFALFTLMAASFFRLVYVTIADPPYVPLGPSAPPARRDRITYRAKDDIKNIEGGIAMGEYEAGDKSRDTEAQRDPDSPGLELFYTKDVFVCEQDGRPRWCSSCANWKPDRAHHCSSSGRCITKMDHFCPWIGGPIGENNFKFFIQFNFYAALYCTHVLVVMAIFIHKQIVTEDETLNNHFAAVLALAGMFGMFTGSMFSTCAFLAMSGLTQVEKLGSKTKAYRLAVLKPSAKELEHTSPSADPQIRYHEITYPLDNNQYLYPNTQGSQAAIQTAAPTRPRASNPDRNISDRPTSSPVTNLLHRTPISVSSLRHQHEVDSSPGAEDQNVAIPMQPASSLDTYQSVTSDNTGIHPNPPISARDKMATRTFTILEMKTGENPWDLGSPLLNIETVMGTSIIEYLLPIKRSPCCYHENVESYYELGPTVDRMKVTYNLMNVEDIRGSSRLARFTPSAKASLPLP